jgi:hypothetical protein
MLHIFHPVLLEENLQFLFERRLPVMLRLGASSRCRGMKRRSLFSGAAIG